MLSQNTAHRWLEGELRPPGPWTWLALGVLMVAVLGTALSNVAARWAPTAAREAGPERVARQWPDRPIPLEWRWAPRPVKVDHMFRKQR